MPLAPYLWVSNWGRSPSWGTLTGASLIGRKVVVTMAADRPPGPSLPCKWCCPHIKRASPKARADYRKKLPPELRGTFDQLAEALASPRYELG
jgi:hypothetical protein